ncbi:MAG: hypothetical protein NT019_02235 [Candidatus Adlerbacteria bacterium]|nr:hypothetical protein [Candidatus Adlerbacteria bacterium]
MNPQQNTPSLRGRTVVTTVVIVVVLIALCLVLWMFRNTAPLSGLLGSTASTTQQTTGSTNTQTGSTNQTTPNQENWSTYTSTKFGFSIRYPKEYRLETPYAYSALGPGLTIPGVKFDISTTSTKGTNLAQDTGVSVETLTTTRSCTADLFVHTNDTVKTMVDHGTTYSVAESSDAGAGNLYHETIFALPGTSPCTAVRYFIHSTQLGNYPPNTVVAFDQTALLAQFDAIRQTLVLGR